MYFKTGDIYRKMVSQVLSTITTSIYLFPNREDDDAVPDVPALVQELLLNLFTTVYNHQDDEGR